MQKGRFITLEGGEGAGKSTVAQNLLRRLEEAGYKVRLTREPGGTALGQRLRKELLHGDAVAPLAELLLYAADRAQHVTEVIAPALKRGEVVLCDRFSDSTVAYQGYGRGLDPATIEDLNQLAQQGLVPDLTLWLDIPVEVGMKRVQGRGAGDRLESENTAFHQKVRAGFQALAKRESLRIVRIDASQKPDKVADDCWQVIQDRLIE